MRLSDRNDNRIPTGKALKGQLLRMIVLTT